MSCCKLPRRIVFVSFLFVLADLIQYPTSYRKNDITSSTRDNSLIQIFYNLFIDKPKDAGRVLGIFSEQILTLKPLLHDMNISVNAIGYRLPYFPKLFNNKHYREGGEDVTLHSLWKHCQAANPGHDAKVVYLHSKGSYHSDESNDRLRRFLTEGALSPECANLPKYCDVCSSRMSPHPHPHTSGNMWLARCSYIAKLRDPFILRRGELPQIFNKDNGCKGFGRFFFEHWVYSHPSVKPCDLYPGKEYTWAYENIPEQHFHKDLRKAPRFEFDVFASILHQKYWYCRGDVSSQTPKLYLNNRIWYYKQLYVNVSSPEQSWFLKKFLNASLLTDPKKER